MKILVDILDRADFKQFSEGCFSRYVDKIKGLEVEDTLHFPMSTSGKRYSTTVCLSHFSQMMKL